MPVFTPNFEVATLDLPHTLDLPPHTLDLPPHTPRPTPPWWGGGLAEVVPNGKLGDKYDMRRRRKF